MTELLKLAPPTAVLLTRNEAGVTVSEEEVEVELVQRGDLLKVDHADVPRCCNSLAGYLNADSHDQHTQKAMIESLSAGRCDIFQSHSYPLPLHLVAVAKHSAE